MSKALNGSSQGLVSAAVKGAICPRPPRYKHTHISLARSLARSQTLSSVRPSVGRDSQLQMLSLLFDELKASGAAAQRLWRLFRTISTAEGGARKMLNGKTSSSLSSRDFDPRQIKKIEK